jgi:hypothetical protein
LRTHHVCIAGSHDVIDTECLHQSFDAFQIGIVQQTTCIDDPVQTKRAELLKKIVDFMKSLIVYNVDLTKPLIRAGGKRRRMQTKRNGKKGCKKSKRNNKRKS